jgi:phosphoribulokinase
MSAKHPIIAVTGSSGAGTTTSAETFRKMFNMMGAKAALVEGDSFHRYTRREMEIEVQKAKAQGKHLSYFGPQTNDFQALEQFFRTFGEEGKGRIRRYLHTFDEAVPYNQMPGTFTPWQDLPEDADVLFYEGLHGGVVDGDVNVAQHVDFLIGMVPIVNLEWIQKFVRDTRDRGYSREAVMDSITRSMDDYLSYITPQFSRTHINFQRVPTVDTSNPFSAKAIPTPDESFVVIRIMGMKQVDFPYLLAMIDGSFMSRHDTLVIPGGKMGFAMELIIKPALTKLINTGKIG